MGSTEDIMQGRDRSVKGRLWIALGVLLGLAVNAAAQGPMGPPPGAGGGGLPPLFMRVQLTDQQRTQIKALVDEQRESRRPEVEERRALQQQLTSAIYGGTTAADSLNEVVTRLAELQKQGLDADVALQTKIAALLTDEQRQQIIALEAARPGPPARTR
jgi:periplasmic protein CpxP/Spy